MEIKNIKKIFVLSILIIISLYIILNYKEESTNHEAPKRATFVNNYIGKNFYYG